MKHIFLILYVAYIASCSSQRIAPGVPPQHYGQNQFAQVHHQVPQYQVNQNPQLHPEIPVQQIQVQPQQQLYQQPQPQHQPNVQAQQPEMHHKHHGASQGQILNAANIAHEKDHIVEHMEVPLDTSKMSEQELQFHYFKMHDADNNNKLDGCELIKSLIHWHEQGGKDTHVPEDKIFKDDELVALIDPILGMDDSNHDGYIDYPEFVRAQQKATASSKTS